MAEIALLLMPELGGATLDAEDAIGSLPKKLADALDTIPEVTADDAPDRGDDDAPGLEEELPELIVGQLQLSHRGNVETLRHSPSEPHVL